VGSRLKAINMIKMIKAINMISSLLPESRKKSGRSQSGVARSRDRGM
jgi:hypothetical protein